MAESSSTIWAQFGLNLYGQGAAARRVAPLTCARLWLRVRWRSRRRRLGLRLALRPPDPLLLELLALLAKETVCQHQARAVRTGCGSETRRRHPQSVKPEASAQASAASLRSFSSASDARSACTAFHDASATAKCSSTSGFDSSRARARRSAVAACSLKSSCSSRSGDATTARRLSASNQSLIDGFAR